MSDRAFEALLAALKLALAEPGEHRLYRSGKLPGLFSTRTGAPGEAAAQALRDGYLESVRTETKGKITIDWVKLTPKGIEFLHTCESPLVALRELQSALKASRDSAPALLDAMQQKFLAGLLEMQGEMKKAVHRLDALAERVEEALRRTGAVGPTLPAGVSGTVPWANEVLTYLEQRRGAGATGECSLPELFEAVRHSVPKLSIIEFQDGLRRMYDHKTIRLLPADSYTGTLAEPEYAMVDGPDVFYYVKE